MKIPLLMSLRRAWNDWWYGPISPVPLGLFRIIFGVLILAYVLLLFPDRVLWFSEHGALTLESSDQYNGLLTLPYRINLLHGVRSDRWLTGLFVVFILFAITLTIGLATRLSSIVVFVLMATLHNRDAMIHNSGDTLMMVMTAYLVLAPAGAACSVDRLIRIRRGREGALPPSIVPWVQRLMQVQVAVIYCSTSLSKLGGDTWRHGTAVYYAIALPDIRRFPVPWIDAQHAWFVHLLTWGTMGVEMSLWTLIWVPRLRLYVLAAGVLLHLGIEYALNIPLFAFLMITSYILFLTDADIRNFLRWVGRRKVIPGLSLKRQGDPNPVGERG